MTLDLRMRIVRCYVLSFDIESDWHEKIGNIWNMDIPTNVDDFNSRKINQLECVELKNEEQSSGCSDSTE